MLTVNIFQNSILITKNSNFSHSKFRVKKANQNFLKNRYHKNLQFNQSHNPKKHILQYSQNGDNNNNNNSSSSKIDNPRSPPPPPNVPPSLLITNFDDHNNPYKRIKMIFIIIIYTTILFIIINLIKELNIKYDEIDLKTVSIIIPVLNEEKGLNLLFQNLNKLNPEPNEIIIVDGGSHDNTIKICKKNKSIKLIKSNKGRGRQMNRGAKEAKSEYIAFLHADTKPPEDLIKVINKILKDKSNVAGGFRIVFKYGEKRKLIWTEFHSLIKTWYVPLIFNTKQFLNGFRFIFGDCIIFCRKSDFDAVKGYNDYSVIMEDVELLFKLHEYGYINEKGKKRKGKIKLILNRVSETSPRRISKWGQFKATFYHCLFVLNWYFGASSEKMKDLYYKYYTDNYR